MSVATFEQPDVTTQTAAQYKANIDAATRVISEAAANFAPHEADPPDMTIVVDGGKLSNGNSLTTKTAQTTSTITAPVTNNRIDRVVLNISDGTISVVAGSEAASPSAPSFTASQIPVCQVLLTPSTTEIGNADITDERPLLSANIGVSSFVLTLLDDADASAFISTLESDLGRSINPFGGKLLHVQDQKTSGAKGGSASSGSNTRDLNTVLTNEITGASLATNQITLPIGDYYIEASAPIHKTGTHQLRIYDTTAAVYITDVDGTSEYTSASNGVQVRSLCVGRFSLSAESNIELRHQVETARDADGLGVSAGGGSTIDHETYTDVKIWKVG